MEFCWCPRKCLILGHRLGIARFIFLQKLLFIIVQRNRLSFGNGFLKKLRDFILMELINV